MNTRKVFWRHLIVTGICVALALAMGFVYLDQVDSIYEAETRLHVQEKHVGSVPTTAFDKDRQFIATQAEIIRSPLIVRKALEKTSISMPPDFDGDKTKFVLERLNVAPVLQTDVLTISYRSSVPEEAIGFVNALVTSYQQQLKNVETTNNSEILELLSRREQEIRNELARLNEKHVKLRKGSQLIGQSRDAVNVHSAMLNQLAQKLTDARLRKFELASRLDSLNLATADESTIATTLDPASVSVNRLAAARLPMEVNPVDDQQRAMMMADLFRDPNEIGSKYLAELESQLDAAKLRIQMLNRKFGEKHIETRQAEDEAAKWEQLFYQRLHANSESVRSEYERIVKSEADLEQLYLDEQQAVKELDTFIIQDEKIRSEIDRTEMTYNTILQRLGDIQLTDQALENGQSSVIVRDLQGSDIRAELIWPQPKSFLALCAMVGLCGGFLMTFGLDAMRSPLSRA